MPFKRRAPVKKRKFQRKKKAPTNKNLARRVRKLERAPELKYKDVNSTVAPTAAGTAVAALFIAQGDDFNQRIGEEVNLMYVNYKIRYAIASGTTGIIWRTMLVWDKQNNGIGPIFLASSSLTEGLLDDTTITNTTLSPHNYRTKQRYQVLYDQTHISNPQEPTCERTMYMRKNFKFHGMKIKYSGSGGTIAELPSRELFWVHFSPGASVSVTFTSRTWYTDQ